MPGHTLTAASAVEHLGTVGTSQSASLGTDGWQAFVVGIDGTQVAELAVITLGDLDEQMGRPANMAIGVAKSNATQLAYLTDALEDGYEVQVYFDSVLMLWGVPVQQSTQSDSPVVTFALIECVPWYLSRRRNKRGEDLSDLLLNGGFESAKHHWTGAGSVVTTEAHGGTHSLEVDNDGGTTAQKIVVRQASTLVCSVRVKIDSATWVGPNSDYTGLEIYATPWTGFGGSDKYATAALDGTLTQDAWVTLSAVVDLPDGFWDVFFRLRGPDGKVWFDDATVAVFPRPRRTEWAGIFPPPEAPTVDQGALFREALLSNIDGLQLWVDVPDTGVVISDEPGAYVDRYLSEVGDLVSQREDGMDWAGVYSPPTRGVRAWYPRSARGTSHAGFVLTFGAENDSEGGPNLASYSRDVDQTRARTTVVVVGEGGFTGEAEDESTWYTVLEEIVRAPGATPIPDLEGVAREHLRDDPAKVTALSVVTHERANDLIGVLRLADKVVTYVADGSVSFSGTYQVVARRVHPKDKTMTLTLNKVA